MYEQIFRYIFSLIEMAYATSSVSEFNKFEPRLKSAKKPVSIEWRLKSWRNEYDFKWNQPYLSRSLDLSRGSNSLNSASGHMQTKKT